MAVTKDEAKLTSNTIRTLIMVADRMKLLRQEGGYGSIKLDMKDGLVVYSEATVRDHI